MKIDINKLAEHFARAFFQVEAVYRCTLEPGEGYTGMTQPYPGFLFPLQGEGVLQFEGTAYTLSKGKIVHGGADMDMVYHATRQTKWEYLLVLYRTVESEQEQTQLSHLHFEIQMGESPRLSELLKQLYEVSALPGGLHRFRREALFRAVLDEVFSMVQMQKGEDARLLFEQVSAYMHEHFMDGLSVSGIAKRHNVNENRLSYVFQKYSGMGPGDYLVAYRLNRAKEFMLNMNVPVHVVAKSVGYLDPFHFSRMFKRQFGLSPSEFQDKFKNNA